MLGMQPVREAIRAHHDALLEVLVEGPAGASPRLDALARFASDQGVRLVHRVARAELDALARGVVHQGAAAVAPALRLVEPAALASDPELFAIALDRIQDPQNFGAIVRSAVALGPAAVVWPASAAAPLTPATFRASAGAIEHARLCRVASLASWLADLAAAGATVIGLDAQGDQDLDDLPVSRPLVLVVGSEHRGLAKPIRRACTALARLRQPGPIDSVNASVAAGIALYTTSKKTSSPAT